MECVNLLFLILLSSSLSHTVRAVEKTLDMAPDAVDDVFSGCRERMLKAVTEADGLLQKELQTTEKFAEMWKNTKTCNKQIQGLTSFHLNALESYANSKDDIRKTFNDKVYASGNNATTYKNEFSFKSLHFLLTDAMKHLNGGKTHMQVVSTAQAISIKQQPGKRYALENSSDQEARGPLKKKIFLQTVQERCLSSPPALW
uniref:NAD(P)(+)--arginine ADP-ribosyltransferase n=1 Tax=Astyanax mexicanus TaxID=7994 RepID=A0A3B1JL89_ASTMX